MNVNNNKSSESIQLASTAIQATCLMANSAGEAITALAQKIIFHEKQNIQNAHWEPTEDGTKFKISYKKQEKNKITTPFQYKTKRNAQLDITKQKEVAFTVNYQDQKITFDDKSMPTISYSVKFLYKKSYSIKAIQIDGDKITIFYPKRKEEKTKTLNLAALYEFNIPLIQTVSSQGSEILEKMVSLNPVTVRS